MGKYSEIKNCQFNQSIDELFNTSTREAQSATVPFSSEGGEPNFAMVFTMPRELPLDEYLHVIDFSSPALMPNSVETRARPKRR